MHWIVLLASAVLEAMWATALGQSHGFTDPFATTVFALGLVLSMLGLGYAAKRIPMSTAYAVWTGTGAALTVTWAMIQGNESPTLLRILFLAGIVGCVIGLKLVPSKSYATGDSKNSATIRTKVTVPLEFPDGLTATATVLTFDGLADGKEHLLLAFGPLDETVVRPASPETAPLVRVHSECLTGDVFGSQRCDCGPQLHEAVAHLSQSGGFLLYLRQEGRGIGLYPKMDAYALQDKGLDTFAANLALGHEEDARDYTAAAQMLRAVGAGQIKLLSNNPDKATQLAAHGISVTERIPTGVFLSPNNRQYLISKREHAAHTLDLPPRP